MKLILFDPKITRQNLLPLTYTRPVGAMRLGILTIAEKWGYRLKSDFCYHTETYLQHKFEGAQYGEGPFLYINGSVCPDNSLVADVELLQPGQVLMFGDTVIAFISGQIANPEEAHREFQKVPHSGDPVMIENLWDIFSLNGKELDKDFDVVTHGRKSAPIDPTNIVFNAEKVFIEPGAKVLASTLNASNGPIYIGKSAEVMEGCLVRGGFALCDHSVLKMGAKIYGPTTIGPHSKVGGEVNNSVFFSNSNKAHDGFIGNSVIGEWCNIGADSNNSNLKNNYAEVKLWNYTKGSFVGTGLQFCGLVMGDHSKCGINTMFNTGTVVGVSCNVFGSGFPRNFIPDFSWGGAQGLTTYSTDKAFETAELVFKRRNVLFSDAEKHILQTVFTETEKWRK